MVVVKFLLHFGRMWRKNKNTIHPERFHPRPQQTSARRELFQALDVGGEGSLSVKEAPDELSWILFAAGISQSSTKTLKTI